MCLPSEQERKIDSRHYDPDVGCWFIACSWWTWHFWPTRRPSGSSSFCPWRGCPRAPVPADWLFHKHFLSAGTSPAGWNPCSESPVCSVPESRCRNSLCSNSGSEKPRIYNSTEIISIRVCCLTNLNKSGCSSCLCVIGKSLSVFKILLRISNRFYYLKADKLIIYPLILCFIFNM